MATAVQELLSGVVWPYLVGPGYEGALAVPQIAVSAHASMVSTQSHAHRVNCKELIKLTYNCAWS